VKYFILTLIFIYQFFTDVVPSPKVIDPPRNVTATVGSKATLLVALKHLLMMK